MKKAGWEGIKYKSCNETRKTDERWTTILKFTSDYVTEIASYDDNYFIGTEYGEVYRVDSNGKSLIFKCKSSVSSVSVSDDVIGVGTLDDGVYISNDFKNFVQELTTQNYRIFMFVDTNNLYALSRIGSLYIKESGVYKTHNLPHPSTNLSFAITQNAIFIASYEYG